MSCLPWQTIESVARLVMLVLADSLAQKAHSPVSTFFHHFVYLKNLEVVKGKKDMQIDYQKKQILWFAHYLVSSCSLAQKHYSGAMLVFSCAAWDSTPNNRAHSPDSNHKMFRRHMFSSLEVIEETYRLCKQVLYVFGVLFENWTMSETKKSFAMLCERACIVGLNGGAPYGQVPG